MAMRLWCLVYRINDHGWETKAMSHTVRLPGQQVLPLQLRNGHLVPHWRTFSEHSSLAASDEGMDADVNNRDAKADKTAKSEPYFTDAELRNIHARSGHPHHVRMHTFLRRARPGRCPPHLRKQLENIFKSCEPCQKYSVSSRRVRASLPSEKGKFNEDGIVDIFVIQGQSNLSILDRDTKFLACVRLKTTTAAAILDALLRA